MIENSVIIGDALAVLAAMPSDSVRCCMTSPPYWGLRNYGVDGQIGLEKTPEEYVSKVVRIFREVRRVLTPDGTLWLNLGDSYARDARKGQHKPGDSGKASYVYDRGGGRASAMRDLKACKLKPKDLIGIPWMIAFALRLDGWYLRADIIWSKPNVMPESVTDRPTKSHEYLFLLSKSEKYFYDIDAVREPFVGQNEHDRTGGKYAAPGQTEHSSRADGTRGSYKTAGRNRRTVWTINTKPYKGAHFATFPAELPNICILAGSEPGDLILDPFAGSGTTCSVAKLLGRRFVGIELNSEYAALADKRIAEGK